MAKVRDFDILWIETLLFALAHYFTSRRFIDLPSHVLKKIQEEELLEDDHHPLFLSRHTIRFLFFDAFVAYLYQEKRLLEARSVLLLGIVAAYVLGCIVRGIGAWLGRRWENLLSRLWGDLNAIVVIRHRVRQVSQLRASGAETAASSDPPAAVSVVSADVPVGR